MLALPEPEPDRFFGADGNTLLLAWGASTGAYLGGSLGWLANTDSGGAVATGLLLGGAAVPVTIYVLLGDREVSLDQSMALGSAGTLGAFTGIQAARMFIPPGDESEHDRIVLAGVLGTMAGTGLGVALMPVAPDRHFTWSMDIGALIGWQTAAAANDLVGLSLPEHRQLRAGVSLAGATAMGATMYALRASGAQRPSGSLSAIGLAHGTWLGLWSPYLVTDNPESRHVWAGLRMGLGTGYIATQALAPLVDPSGKSVALQLTGIAAGNALGAGIPMALGHDPAFSPRPVVLPMLAGGVAGQALGAAVSPYWEVSSNDALLMSMLGLWTGYQAIGWGYYGSYWPGSPSIRLGTALTAAGSGTLLTMGLAPLVEVEAAEAILIGTSGGWGTWYGGWIGHLLRMDPRAHWVTTLSAGNAALLGTAMLSAGPLQASWADVGVVNGLAALGGASGALVGVVASPDVDTVATAGLIGTTLGLGAGIALAARSSGGDGAAFLPEIPMVERLPVDPMLQVQPWADEEGNPGVWVELTVREK